MTSPENPAQHDSHSVLFLKVTHKRGAEPSSELCSLVREITIGRRSDNRLILNDPSINEQHARISPHDGHALLQDLNSRGGTHVDGRRIGIGAPSVVRAGQVITIGPYTLEVLDREADGIEKGFLDKIQANPRDDDMRTVYADWLEQAGQAEQAEFLRAQLEIKTLQPDAPRYQQLGIRIRALAPKMSLSWRRTVARPMLENCPTDDKRNLRVEVSCPRQWDQLAPTPSPKERYCDACKRNVHYAPTIFEAQSLALAGHCIAVDIAQPRSPNDLSPRPPPWEPPGGGVPIPGQYVAPPGYYAPPPGWNEPPAPAPPAPAPAPAPFPRQTVTQPMPAYDPTKKPK